jgi:glycosyltransferase involved in cell wall biosynthesis
VASTEVINSVEAPNVPATSRPFRLGYVLSHPIQYQSPMLRHIAQDPEIELRVFYMSDMSVRKFDDPGFGVPVEWDVPLLDGYTHEFLPRLGGPKVTPLLRPFVLRLEDSFRKQKLDALWLHGYKHQANLRAIFTAWRLKIPTFVRGESNGRGAGCGTGFDVRESVLRSLFRRIDAFLFIGKLNRDFYRDLGVDDSRLFFTPYAVDNAFFREAVDRASASRDELLRDLNIPAGNPVILYASKLVSWKRPLDLLEAYAKIAGEFPTDRVPYLVYVGDGDERPRLEQRIRELALSTVRLVGFKNQSELPRFYEMCSVFVLPSQHEPWGLAVNEILNAAKPVVVTEAVGCAPDLVRNGYNGFVVPVGNIASLAAHLKYLLQDDQLRARMGSAGKRLVARFSYEQDLLGLKQALHQVCRSVAS